MIKDDYYSVLLANATQSLAPTTAWVLQELLHKIIVCELAPGEKVTQEQLAQMLDGSSRTPLREALKELEHFGFIIRHANRTIRIAPMVESEIRELAEIRARLESLMTSEAATRVAKGEVKVDTLDSIAKAMIGLHKIGNDIDTYISLGSRFHKEIAVMSGMHHAAKIIDGLQVTLSRYRYQLATDHCRFASRLEEHLEIYEAIKRGDAETAGRAMQNHIYQGFATYKVLDHTVSPAAMGAIHEKKEKSENA